MQLADAFCKSLHEPRKCLVATTWLIREGLVGSCDWYGLEKAIGYLE